eukprot:5634650-Pleurochrysis_carterae.AAC.1
MQEKLDRKRRAHGSRSRRTVECILLIQKRSASFCGVHPKAHVNALLAPQLPGVWYGERCAEGFEGGEKRAVSNATKESGVRKGHGGGSGRAIGKAEAERASTCGESGVRGGQGSK